MFYDTKVSCPCCGYITIQHIHDICPVCFWHHEPVQEDNPDEVGWGPNRVSLTQARENYLNFGACSEDMLAHVRPPLDDERNTQA